ncbi:alcohol dehydrogenase [bacterium]|nr:alcohol dehydrogenase [bacterium]
MKAIVTTGNGGYDKLVYKEVPTPSVGPGEVLIKVLAAGVNNTEINTRVGWYSDSIKVSTNSVANDGELAEIQKADGGWDLATPFPFIQGTDCCGVVVEVAENANSPLLGKRVLVRPCMRPDGFGSMRNIWMGSDFDGAFAQFVKVPASEVFVIDSNWSDVELGSIPCSYGSAENMLLRAKVSSNDHVLIAGASGGVGSAAVQLAKIRGACVTAIVGSSKFEHAKEIGADKVIERGADYVSALGQESVDVVVDNVGGRDFESMLQVMRRGGRYVSSGAIGGPIVNLDLRTFYLKDLTLVGCTAWDEPVFKSLVDYIEGNKIVPLVAKTFALQEIVKAQTEFLEKKHFGKFVLVPEH